MKRFTVLIFLALLSAGTTKISAQTFTPVYTTAIGSNINGYYEYLPQGYHLAQNAGKQYPVIFYFHGGTDLGNTNNNNLEGLKRNGIPLVIAKGAMPPYFNNGTDTFQYIIICPQFKNEYPQSDAGLVIDYILARPATYRINVNKVYSTGFSFGGRAVWQYLMSSVANAKKIAASIPIAQFCYPAPPLSQTSYPAQAGVALWALQNTNDVNSPSNTCGTNYTEAFNSYNPVIPAKITVACIPGASYCTHLDTMPNHIYNPSLFTLPGYGKSIYHWFYQYQQTGNNNPPVARAGNDVVISLPANLVTLNGISSSDIDGTIALYRWRKIAGPASGSITDSTAAQTTATELVAGSYQFQLTVTDNLGAVGRDTMIVTVNAANLPPVARAGADQNITLPANSITLNGSASSDADGAITLYRWKKITGPTQGTITDTTAAQTAATNLVQGSYRFELTVTDNNAAIGKDTLTVNVNPPGNMLPVARAGNDQTSTHPQDSVTVNGSASSDADVSIASYTWTKISGPSAQIVNGSSAVTIIKNLPAGNYVFELSVTDNSGAVGKDSINITVNPMPMPWPSNTDAAACNKPFTIVVLGSSTGFGTGATPIDSSWVNRYTRYIKSKNSQSNIINLSLGGYTTYQNLNPNGYMPGNRPAPDTARNITKALSYQPDAILINLPTNDVVSDYTNAEQEANYERTMALADAAGVPVWVATTQPRNSLNQGQYNNLKTMRDWITQRFGNKAVDFWNPVADTVGNIVNVYNYDGVHVNNYGHYVFFTRMVAEKILDSLCNSVNAKPVARAGNDTSIIAPASTVNLNGAASFDSDGSITAYEWTKVSGPAGGTITNNSAVQTSVTGLVQGTYLFELKVTDNRQAVGRDTMQVTVSGTSNLAPVARAGNDQNIVLPTNSVTLNGLASSDADGSIVKYRWRKIAGPTQVTITDSTAAQTTAGNLAQGNYQFELTVTDNNNAVGRDTLQVNVVASALRVLIDAGPALTNSPDAYGKYWNNMTDATAGVRVQNAKTTTNVGTSINLEVVNRIDGTYNTSGNGMNNTNNTGIVGDYPASATADYAFANYTATNGSWRFTGLDSLNEYTIKFWGTRSDAGSRIIQIKRADETTWQEYECSYNTNANQAASFTFSGKKTMGFDIRVKSGLIFGYICVVDINIITASGPAPANQSPVARAGNDQSITLPTNSVVLNGFTSSDADGTITLYRWKKIAGPTQGTITDTTAAQTTASNLVQGSYQFELMVTDNNGVSAKDTMIVLVNAAANVPPVARAGNDQSITLPTNSVALNGSTSSDADGTIMLYRWKKIAGPTQGSITDTTAAQTTANNLVQGSYQFELMVTDNNGAAAKDTMIVQVNAASNVPPVARAGNDQSITLPTNSVALNGSTSSDADGTITLYRWKKIAGPTQGTITDTTMAQTTVTNLVQGSYQFELTVTDNNGAAAKDTMIVLVKAATNVPPAARAGIDQSIMLPTNSVALNGSTSSDADGTITLYRWKKIAGPTQGSIADTTAAQTPASNLVQGSYQFELTVTDNNGASAKDTMIVLVNAAANVPPVARAGNDISITLPASSVTLNGSGSADSDGTITNYLWTKISGANVSIANPAAVSTMVSNLREGIYSFELLVTDNNGAASRDTVVVTVSASSVRILIDAGPSLTNSPDANGNYWNNMTDATAGIRVQNAKTTTNTTTAINLEVINRIDGTYNTSGTGLNWTNNSGVVGDYPATATADYAFANYTATNGSWKFTGLDSLKQYVIKFWGTRSDAGSRIIQIKRADESTWQEYECSYNNNYNQAAVFTFTGKANMSFDIRVKSGLIFGYICVVDIKVVAPPASFARQSATVENNSTTTQSVTVITPDEISKALTISPNPFADNLMLKYNGNEKGSGMITVLNDAMKVIASIPVVKTGMQLQQNIHLPGLKNGLYYLQLSIGPMRLTKKIVKQ